MQKLFVYLDKNGDGELNKAETRTCLPNIQFLQFHLQGAIGFPYQASKGQMASLSTNKDGKSASRIREFIVAAASRRCSFPPTSIGTLRIP